MERKGGKDNEIKKILGITLALGMAIVALPVNVDAANKLDVDVSENQTLQALIGEKISPVIFEEISPDLRETLLENNSGIQTYTTGLGADQYEPNDMPSAATIGMSGRAVYGNFHDSTDVADWFKFEVTSADVSNEVPYSFILTNIPADCDYDMYVVNSDISGITHNLQTGTSSEQMVFSFTKAGTYYVVIQSSKGYDASNYYKLYFGRSWAHGLTGWANTGFTFNFDNKAQGTADYLYSSSGWQILDFRNNSAFPDGSVVNYFYLDATHTGDYAGLEKVLRAATDVDRWHEQLGGIDIFDLSSYNYPVKQQWAIHGRVNYANNFAWKPKVKIDFDYPILLQNMSYVR